MHINDAPITVLIADDDGDDRMLIKDAFIENNLQTPLHFVEDGEQLLKYLRREGEYARYKNTPLPGIILLDLNMPKMDGRTALAKIKEDKALRNIPVIVLTTSKADEDIVRTYGLGVNSFITKPVTFEGLLKAVRSIANYWIDTVALPPECKSSAA